jgi:hypothetical protein
MAGRPGPKELFGPLSDISASASALPEGSRKTPRVRGQSITGKRSIGMFNGGPGLPSLSVLPVGEGVPSTSPGTYELASSPWGVKLGNRKSWRRRRAYQQKELVWSSVSGHAERACYTDATTYTYDLRTTLAVRGAGGCLTTKNRL